MKYYDGSKILSLNDANGKKPALRIVVGNRSSGKTVFFLNYIMGGIKKGKFKKFAMISRYKYELESSAEMFYAPIDFMHPDTEVEQGKVSKMGYCPLTVDGDVRGYNIALAASDKIKKVSNLFKDVDIIFWDEFQSSSGDYLKDEASAILSVYDSIARGGGKQSRYVPFICLSNGLTLLNPLFSTLDVAGRITKDVKFLRGNGYVLEQNINESARNARNDSAMHRAMGAEESPEMLYEFDDLSNISKVLGKSTYVCTLGYKGGEYGLRLFDNGLLFCSKNVDSSSKRCYTTNIHQCGLRWTVPPSIDRHRQYYKNGMVRFGDLESRAAFLDFIKY